MTFEELNKDDLIEIELFFNIPIISVYETISEFISNVAPRIRSFFEGSTNNVVAQEFRKLDDLITVVQRTINDLKNSREDLNLYKHWIVLQNLEDSLLALETLDNYSLWSRSTRNINIYAGKIELDYVQAQQETLEQIEVKTGSSDPDTTWYQVAIRNQLKEEDYSSQGGVPLKIHFRNAPTAFLESVVDRIDNGFKSFGVDVQKKMKFFEDDLVILNNKDTLIQSAEILLNLRKGDNPSLPNLGVDQVSILGKSKGSFLFPIIFRQIIEIFATDDSFGSVRVGKIKFEQDAVFIEVEAFSRYQESVEGLIKI